MTNVTRWRAGAARHVIFWCVSDGGAASLVFSYVTIGG
jgi:hypothetical protein